MYNKWMLAAEGSAEQFALPATLRDGADLHAVMREAVRHSGTSEAYFSVIIPFSVKRSTLSQMDSTVGL